MQFIFVKLAIFPEADVTRASFKIKKLAQEFCLRTLKDSNVRARKDHGKKL